ncbi:MAG: hypothetical protein IM337_08445 [Microcystis sp. M110S1]|uniref:hypothetical protein n=1 Tax=unclassified Microcystis TaxID=2643300 RepID=UPI00258E20DC|nr:MULTISPECIES: hypothetical protein [unclassified Microcystis]MCA2873039.1 hypothetical protein [Microcystis sp. M055S1]MCA2974022.1 hypothetical protein [Microcystis sp. M110S1]
MTNNSLEPLTIGNTINTAFRLYRNRFQTYVFFAVRAGLWSLLPLILQLILSQLLYRKFGLKPRRSTTAFLDP